MTTVHHVRDARSAEEDVYIGRPSIFGNPFTIRKDGTRDEVIAAFKVYFHDKLEDPSFQESVDKLRGKRLLCWCAPKACHGEVIAEYLDKE